MRASPTFLLSDLSQSHRCFIAPCSNVLCAIFLRRVAGIGRLIHQTVAVVMSISDHALVMPMRCEETT